MAGSSTSDFARNERRSLAALAHPVSIIALLLWIANDHLLKARYGSVVTGKLSDVAGLIVFPLIVAAVLAWWARNPMRVALICTAVLYGSVNLWTLADSAMESTMGWFLRSVLTQDTTDLFLLPLLVVPWHLWRTATGQSGELRRAWRHALLGIGIATTVATSVAGEESERFTGTVLLDADVPRIEIPVSLTLDGEPANATEAVWVSHAALFFGSDSSNTTESIVDTAIASFVIDNEGDDDLVVIELQDLSLAPAEITWSIVATTEGEPGGILGGGEPAAIPVLQVEVPANTFGPEPQAIAADQESGLNQELGVTLYEFSVTIDDRDSDLALAGPSNPFASAAPISIATADGIIATKTERYTPVPVPSSCTSEPCTFSIWVQRSIPYMNQPIELYGPDSIEVAITEHEMERTQETALADPIEIDGRSWVELSLLVDVDDPPVDAFGKFTELVQVSMVARPLFAVSEDSQYLFDNCCSFGPPKPVSSTCCSWTSEGYLGEDGDKGLVQVAFTINRHTLVPRASSGLTIESAEVALADR